MTISVQTTAKLRKRALWVITGSVLALGAASPAFAAGTTAGTNISNTATATYTDQNGNQQSVPSNTVTFKVDELLDATVSSADPGDVSVFPASTGRALAYTITNTGNGSEAFRLTANAAIGGDQFDPTSPQIYLDANSNGVYDPGVDSLYTPGTNDPVLNPDQSVTVFIVSTIPGTTTDGDRGFADLTARALTIVNGTGPFAAGDVIATAGQGGGDAVVGATLGEGTARGRYLVQSATVSFTKTVAIVNPFGNPDPVPGSILTYTLTANVTGTGTLTNLTIADPIPTGTSYRTGTLTLQGSAISDQADSDAGEFGSSSVTVRLGNVSGGTTRTVTFQVRVN